MKRLIKTVDLQFFRDDATGDWGLTHKNTLNSDTSFNAFWDGIGIFHDVFEHSHEYTNKYFKGEYAMNVGGEMTAMGAMWYLFEDLGVYNRMRNNGYNRYSPGESMKETTLSLMTEAIYSAYCHYGYTLESNVPYQKPVNNSELEYQIETMWNNIKDYYPDRNLNDEQEIEFVRDYRQSITFRKIADLHRYGYRMAQREISCNNHNRNVLSEFIDYWNDLTKNNQSEDMSRMFKGITFKLYKDHGKISWKATFNSMDKYQFNNVTISENRKFHMDDTYIMEEQY